ncbi:hypothetical protein Cgig2_018116 [Carnegiea gigantea]|uniref:Uncharacterized protein n=1 Tax=Carnegiea gigantea TaxID=171969 RepID=A0A9Q1JZ80_9CARY|nr:hypothetical protein Cgig2_018116 [Carnegiea gigantea]
MGNCCGSEEDPNAHITTSTSATQEVRDFKPPTVVPKPDKAERGGRPVPADTVGKIIKPDPKIFTFAELRTATKNFRPDSVLGEGGFGRVYRGWLDETTLAPSKPGVGVPVAVKKCNADSAQGIKEWKVSSHNLFLSKSSLFIGCALLTLLVYILKSM